jgi:hypothetical protein
MLFSWMIAEAGGDSISPVQPYALFVRFWIAS